MGVDSWMFADTDNRVALKIGKKGYLSCPDGTIVCDTSYDGYMHFANVDVYEAVAEWNKEYLTADNIRKPKRESWGSLPDAEEYYNRAVKRYNREVQRVLDYKNNKPDSYMKEHYGKDWKRNIGIDVACYDEDNAALKYPIKVCRSKKKALDYNSLPASKSDPNQGCY